MKNNSILESLKKIYTKMTGKKVVKRKNETDVLSDIAEEYNPNQGGETSSKLYYHNIEYYKGSDYIFITIIKNDKTPFTPATLFNYLETKFESSLSYLCKIISDTSESFKVGMVLVDTKGYLNVSDGTQIIECAIADITPGFIDSVVEL